MSRDKAPDGAQAGHEGGAELTEGGTVLDFLWGPEGAEVSPEHGHAPHAPNLQQVAEDAAAGEALEDALARYASWLESWGERGTPE